MNYEDILQMWGRKLLADAGFNVSEDVAVKVNLTYEESGGCETCSYTEGIVEVYSSSGSLSLDSYTFSQALNELMKIAASEAVLKS